MARVLTLGHVGLHTSDVRRLSHFYQDVVGLKTVVRLPDITIFELGATSPHVHLFITGGEVAGIEPAFDLATEDLTGFQAELAAAGVECSAIEHSATSGHSSFSFVDPDGNRIAVVTAHHDLPAI